MKCAVSGETEDRDLEILENLGDIALYLCDIPIPY